jgi:hypothetical protein
MLRHFLITLGSGRAVLHGEPITYQEIDHQLRRDGYESVDYSLIGDYDLLYSESTLIGVCFVSEFLESTGFAKCSNVECDGDYVYFVFACDPLLLTGSRRIQVTQCIGASFYRCGRSENEALVIPAWEGYAKALDLLSKTTSS